MTEQDSVEAEEAFEVLSSKNLDKVLSRTPEGEKSFNDIISQSVVSRTDYEHLKGVKQHYKHKGYWSEFLMWAIACMIGYQMILLFLVGINMLDFRDYDWLLPGLLVQNLAQIGILAVYAVKNLFSDITPKNIRK